MKQVSLSTNKSTALKKLILTQLIFPRLEVNGFAFDFESILWAKELGFKISEIPVKIINHRASTVNVFKDSFKMLRDIYKIRRHIDKERKADRK